MSPPALHPADRDHCVPVRRRCNLIAPYVTIASVDDRVLAAATNNAALCDLVCRSHRIPTVFGTRVWAASKRSPRFYPDAMTLVPDVEPREALRSVRDGPGCAVKDSFAALPLDRCGFEVLFEARWIYRDSVPASHRPEGWAAIETDEALSHWGEVGGLSAIIGPQVLLNPAVRILSGDDGASGGILNRTGSVVGVSNVFAATGAADEVWAGILGAAAAAFPSTPLVGYERGESLEAALANGFSQTGTLRVWSQTEPGLQGA